MTVEDWGDSGLLVHVNGGRAEHFSQYDHTALNALVRGMAALAFHASRSQAGGRVSCDPKKHPIQAGDFLNNYSGLRRAVKITWL